MGYSFGLLFRLRFGCGVTMLFKIEFLLVPLLSVILWSIVLLDTDLGENDLSKDVPRCQC